MTWIPLKSVKKITGKHAEEVIRQEISRLSPEEAQKVYREVPLRRSMIPEVSDEFIARLVVERRIWMKKDSLGANTERLRNEAGFSSDRFAKRG